MNILGINAYHGDSSACMIIDGKLIVAVEEERFRRVKHWAGFPVESVRNCLKTANITIEQVHHIAINRNPKANLIRKAMFAFSKKPSLQLVRNRFSNAMKVRDIRSVLSESLSSSPQAIKAQIHNVEHHRAHLASAYFVSPFDSAAVVSVDGFGDFVSAMWGVGRNNKIEIKDQVYFPHSVGLFYLAMTQYLGFPKYGDEYKVMGLSAYGKPAEIEKMQKIILLKPKGLFELNLDYFVHHAEGVSMTWDDGEPVIGKAYSEKLVELLGPERKPGEPVEERHKNIAASMQAMYEKTFFHILDHVYRQTRNPNLCLAGGCAFNSLANGKIFDQSKFKELYIQSAAGDAGGALGAAYFVWNQELGRSRSFVMDHAYWGSDYSDENIENELGAVAEELKRQNCDVKTIPDQGELCEKTAQAIAAGKVVGWFQGKMEWGPRALGNRSILCDPRRSDMKDILNTKIKRREEFRPFAPSILREEVKNWFETDYDVPFMMQVYMIKEGKRKEIPAVTHVDGTGRLQTVGREQNPLYYRLISSFGKLTGVPILLNTSFNENEPIVCRPIEALECFLRTKMDVLVLEKYFIERN